MTDRPSIEHESDQHRYTSECDKCETDGDLHMWDCPNHPRREVSETDRSSIEQQLACSGCGGTGYEPCTEADADPARTWLWRDGVVYGMPCVQCDGSGVTDRPSIEQQLADVMAPVQMSAAHWEVPEFREGAKFIARTYAAAIIAAVNEGRCPPIVPEGSEVLPGCTCPWDVHYPENRGCARFGL